MLFTLWPFIVRTHESSSSPTPGYAPRDAVSSQSFIVSSRLPLTMCLPLGAKATQYTLLLWPLGPSKRSTMIPVVVSQIWTFISSDAAATYRPSSDTETAVTPPSILKMCTSSPLRTSQRRTVLSPLPEATYRPLPANAKE